MDSSRPCLNCCLRRAQIQELDVSSGFFGAIEQLSPHCAPSRLPNITAPPMSGRLDGSAVVSEWIAECAVTKRHWGNPATGCGTPTQPGPSDGWSDTRRVYRPGFLPLPSSLSPPSSLNLLRPRASRAVPTGSLSGRDRRTCEKTVPCGEILRRRAPHVGSARGSIAFARGTGCNCWPNMRGHHGAACGVSIMVRPTVRNFIAGVLVSTVVNLSCISTADSSGCSSCCRRCCCAARLQRRRCGGGVCR